MFQISQCQIQRLIPLSDSTKPDRAGYVQNFLQSTKTKKCRNKKLKSVDDLCIKASADRPRCDFSLAAEDVSNLTFTDLVRLFLAVKPAPLAAPNPHLFPPHAFGGAPVTFWEIPEVRHGFGAARQPVRSASAHGEQPVAPRHHGRRHGRDHGSADDDDAATAFKRWMIWMLRVGRIITVPILMMLRMCVAPRCSAPHIAVF
jgi:hypothetical protein